MAWTAPMTFVANSPLTAAQLNTHLRDNFLETAPAKATEQGGYFVTDTAHRIVERVGRRQTISTEEATTSTSYDDLATQGPTVTVQTGELALALWSCEMRSSNSEPTTCRVTVDVTGDTTIAGDDIRALTNSTGAAGRHQSTHAVFFDDLNPGENTWTMKYRTSSGEATFQRRRLIVLPY
ncbi:hypothetical protein [Nocardiopsis sp. YSL2]|uniref:hypothetical protein n=1 Tax=Nocardiopsis sp. YSL2 TaxID=2939492 RepID=UPI0026F42495|nr:hypothetical protein [Nocardiopsis sp. YSL2]